MGKYGADLSPLNVSNHPVREVEMDIKKDGTENLGALHGSAIAPLGFAIAVVLAIVFFLASVVLGVLVLGGSPIGDNQTVAKHSTAKSNCPGCRADYSKYPRSNDECRERPVVVVIACSCEYGASGPVYSVGHCASSRADKHSMSADDGCFFGVCFWISCELPRERSGCQPDSNGR